MAHLKSPFRSFFVAAAASAILLIGVWILVVSGRMTFETTLPASKWHAHEMIFGYLGAVLAGFLLTATVHWTGRETVGGKGLLVLLLLWLLARVVHGSNSPFPGSLAIEPLFFAGVAFAVGRAVIAARRWRNLAFALLMGLMGISDLLIHLVTMRSIGDVWMTRGLWLAIDSVALSILIFGGRILPLFTKSALSLPSARSKSALDYAGLGAVVLLMVAHAISLSAEFESILWAIAGALTLARLYGWNGTRTLRRPLLWVLHLGWLFVGIGMLLVAYALQFPLRFPVTSAHHMLFIGGFGTLSMGMMARVALGHTGREKVAGRPAAIAFALMILAGGIRTSATWFGAENYVDLLFLAGFIWSLSFLLFLVAFVPVLLSPRVDGKEG